MNGIVSQCRTNCIYSQLLSKPPRLYEGSADISERFEDLAFDGDVSDVTGDAIDEAVVDLENTNDWDDLFANLGLSLERSRTSLNCKVKSIFPREFSPLGGTMLTILTDECYLGKINVRGRCNLVIFYLYFFLLTCICSI